MSGSNVFVPDAYLALIASERVSATTREVLEERMAGPALSPGLLSAGQRETLRAVLARVIPQDAGREIDLAGYVEVRLQPGKGDGWRYAVLPEDAEAYRQGLDRLAEKGFAGMDAAGQDAVLRGMAEEKSSVDGRWFEEVRAAAVGAYVAHPATMARLGFSGIGVGGARTPFQGYVCLGIDEPEAWEPEGAAGGSR